MAAPSTVDEFLDLLRKSAVVDEKRLSTQVLRLRAARPAPATAGEAAALLIRDGVLTNFQAEQLMLGKWRRFTIGRYKVLERLGSGGMGSVYLCEHKVMRRRVAVKVLPSAKANDPAALERFHREARAVAALDHPNIVHAYDIDQDESLHFLVMEYVDGASLQEIVKRSGPLDFVRAAHYVRQAAEGLRHAHANGLVHRDIKPGNLMVDRTGVVKLLDMGLARFFNDEDDILTKKYDENVLGTADYLAPEQATDSHSVDIRADIYSLGATFYFVLTGRTPFGEGTIAQKLLWHQTRQPRPIRSLRPDLPESLAAVLEKMMEKDPQKRYQAPGDVAAAVEPWTRTPIAPPLGIGDAAAESGRIDHDLGGGNQPGHLTRAGPLVPLLGDAAELADRRGGHRLNERHARPRRGTAQAGHAAREAAVQGGDSARTGATGWQVDALQDAGGRGNVGTPRGQTSGRRFRAPGDGQPQDRRRLVPIRHADPTPAGEKEQGRPARTRRRGRQGGEGP